MRAAPRPIASSVTDGFAVKLDAHQTREIADGARREGLASTRLLEAAIGLDRIVHQLLPAMAVARWRLLFAALA